MVFESMNTFSFFLQKIESVMKYWSSHNQLSSDNMLSLTVAFTPVGKNKWNVAGCDSYISQV